ncbi:85/88 kDa calcium-independent phospholipase A2-like [Clavelina lepadiformis]|uniref:85/88 kDa calcium-independent phospholipase A2-like n=1 Tax=Clavelina lepadiformis TaxID=159417 RepID=UPI00404183FB
MNFASFVLDKINQVVSDPYSVREFNDASWKEADLIVSNEPLALHFLNDYFDIFLLDSSQPDRAFRLCHLPASKRKDANDYYDKLISKLPALLCRNIEGCFDVSKLQASCTMIRTRTIWSPAHIAVEAGLVDVFQSGSPVTQWIDSQSCEQHFTPLHLACQLRSPQTVVRLIECGADLSKCDDNGNSSFHLVVNQGSHEILKVLCSTRPLDGAILDILNNDGESCLHIAAKQNKFRMCRLLIENGANPLHKGTIALPIHFALKHGSTKSVEILLEHEPAQVSQICSKHGGVPLHWCKTKADVKLLFQHRAPADVRSDQHHLPLHIMVLRSRLEAAIAIILGNADVNGKGRNGNTALHLAVLHDHDSLVKMLLLFGADCFAKNDFGETPGLLALRSAKPNKDKIVSMFSCIGSLLVEPSQNNHSNKFSVNDSQVDGCHGNSDDRSKKLKVLCLDGGGVRGLVMTQILMALEKYTGQHMRELFDWVSGTSTGGILAIGLMFGLSAIETQRIYFRLKDAVFKGSRPYDSKPIEEFLKKEFGENTTMRDLADGPKLIITATLADRKPVELYTFKNYDISSEKRFSRNNSFSSKLSQADLSKLKEVQESTLDELVWKVARRSGSAPSYFRAMDQFLDGGLVANNPTLDTLTEIHKYKKMRKTSGSEVPDVGLVVSLGTGLVKTTTSRSVDLVRSTNPVALINSALAGIELMQLMVDAACESSNHVVERARAWCESVGAEYHRLNPPLEEDLSLDETNDEKLLGILWETQVYLHDNQDLIKNIASALKGSSASF